MHLRRFSSVALVVFASSVVAGAVACSSGNPSTDSSPSTPTPAAGSSSGNPDGTGGPAKTDPPAKPDSGSSEKDSGPTDTKPDAAADAGVDPCFAAPFYGDYCGESFAAQFDIEGAEPGYLYTCGEIPGDPDHAKTTAKKPCPNGCFMAPAGQNDRCK